MKLLKNTTYRGLVADRAIKRRLVNENNALAADNLRLKEDNCRMADEVAELTRKLKKLTPSRNPNGKFKSKKQ